MPHFPLFLWTAWSVQNVESNGISTTESEEAVANSIDLRNSPSTMWSTAIGFTAKRRKLACEYIVDKDGNCCPNTAREVR